MISMLSSLESQGCVSFNYNVMSDPVLYLYDLPLRNLFPINSCNQVPNSS